MSERFAVIVIGGGHAGVEAAWAAANLLPVSADDGCAPTVALVTMDPTKIGAMSCNPAIGGLAKGQIVREIDAMNGLMGLAADATGIQFKVLNTSKGAAVHGPRAQCDKHAYARVVQGLIASRPEINVVAGSVEAIAVEGGRVRGVVVRTHDGRERALGAQSVVLTTGTFMRSLMHTGEAKTPGGRFGEASADGISGWLKRAGFELGRLKTGTPPRLSKRTIDWDALAPALGDQHPLAFSDLSGRGDIAATLADHGLSAAPSLERFPVLEQVECRVTHTSEAVHELIRANLHRAPMYSGQIESAGPRYCPSIEDKVVRFADKASHHVFLEPESLEPEHADRIYCNGISTSLPVNVQERIVRALPGCERAAILRPGYAVEYDMVRPHQIRATGHTRRVEGLFLAGQINGTSGYEEAAAQGLVAGINAARLARGEGEFVLGRETSYIGVLMDDLVTKTPVEPYRMFTSRAEHRLLLRADNAADRLTPMARELGLLAHTALGRLRARVFDERATSLRELRERASRMRHEGAPLEDWFKRPDFAFEKALELLGVSARESRAAALFTVQTERFYGPFIDRQQAEIRRSAELERCVLPDDFEYARAMSLRAEARAALERFRPATLGQAGRLEGITPADVTLLSVLVKRHTQQARAGRSASAHEGGRS